MVLLLSPYSPALLNGRFESPDGRFKAQMADLRSRGQSKLPKSAIMADIPAIMADIPAIMADIPALMADLNARRWADLLSQIPHSPIQNPGEYGDSGPSSSTQRTP